MVVLCCEIDILSRLPDVVEISCHVTAIIV